MNKRRKLDMEELNRISIDEFKVTEKMPLVIVLDNVRSLNNIGSVLRTCDALNVKEVFLCGISSTPPNAEIHKTALGAEDSVSWRYFDETIKSIDSLKKDGYEIFSIEQTINSIDLRDFLPLADKKYAFVFGNELKGVSQDVIDSSDGTIEIPQFGTKHSFNIAVTAGIVTWDFFSKISNCSK
jgi:23S rRNA (guanosine2251-2'-O)-methyltransferase